MGYVGSLWPLSYTGLDEAVLTYFTQKNSVVATKASSRLRAVCKVFNYLLIDIDFELYPGTLIISMIKYLSVMFKEWPEKLKGYTLNPHSNHLFNIRPYDGSKKEFLSEEIAAQFHCTTAQLLFLCSRARPNIQTAPSFSRQGWDNLIYGRLEETSSLHAVLELYSAHEAAPKCG